MSSVKLAREKMALFSVAGDSNGSWTIPNSQISEVNKESLTTDTARKTVDADCSGHAALSGLRSSHGRL